MARKQTRHARGLRKDGRTGKLETWNGVAMPSRFECLFAHLVAHFASLCRSRPDPTQPQPQRLTSGVIGSERGFARLCRAFGWRSCFLQKKNLRRIFGHSDTRRASCHLHARLANRGYHSPPDWFRRRGCENTAQAASRYDWGEKQPSFNNCIFSL